MKNKNKFSETYKTYIRTSAVGLEFGLSVALCVLFGYWFDKKFSSFPYGIVFGTIVGFLAGVKRLWVFSKAYLNKKENDKK